MELLLLVAYLLRWHELFEKEIEYSHEGAKRGSDGVDST